MCKSNQSLQGGRYRLLNGADELKSKAKKFHTAELSTLSNNLYEAI